MAVLRRGAEPEPLDELRDVGLEEPTDLDEGHILAPQQLDDGGTDSGLLLGGSSRHDEGDRPRPRPGEDLVQERPSRLAHPVAVVDEQQEWLTPADRAKELQHALGQSDACQIEIGIERGHGADLGHQPGQVGGDLVRRIGSAVVAPELVYEGSYERGEGGEGEDGVVLDGRPSDHAPVRRGHIGQLGQQPGLPAPGLTGHHGQARRRVRRHSVRRRSQGREVPLAPDEGQVPRLGRHLGQFSRGRARRWQGRIGRSREVHTRTEDRRRGKRELEIGRLEQDPLLELAEFGRRIDAELDDEMLAEPAVGGDGLALPPAAVEGEHQLSPKRLAQGVLADELLELGDQGRMPAQRELGLDAELEGLQPTLVEPERLGDRKGLIGQVCQRSPAPHPECFARVWRPPGTDRRARRTPSQRPRRARSDARRPDPD